MKTFKILFMVTGILIFHGCRKDEPKVVVTALPSLASILADLTKNSTISVLNPVPENITLAEHDQYWDERSRAPDSLAKIVAAVVDIRSVIPEETLYLQMRERNIKIIEIDCATPFDRQIEAIPVISREDKINPYVWLSISNVMKMAEIAAKDLSRLFPADSSTILDNLKKLKRRYFSLKSDYESKFSTLERFEAVTFDNSFDYLLSDINLFITHRFPSDESEWTEEELILFEKGVKQGEIHTVIHRWEPAGKIGRLCRENDVRTAILTTGDPKMNNYDNGLYGLLEKNLYILSNTLSEK